jgi:hypothetical protein
MKTLIAVTFLAVLTSFTPCSHAVASEANCSTSVLRLISQAECSAIADYKQVEYTDINYFLRNGKWYGVDRSDLIEKIRSGLNKLPIFRGTVYRGVSFEDSPKRYKQYTTVGAVVVDPAFVSSSQDRSIGESFLTDNGDNNFVLMIIESKTGRDIMGIGASGIDESEREVLFMPGTRFKIVSVKKVRLNIPEYGLDNRLVSEVTMTE